ncbi:hypothetical protein DENIS_4482 [Desulfonema ishimotonii]|uniref:DUF349 domain-containing protein n=1 Tax=Desulfonema ishimotonii TaxID=45657 RepID=A0A401G2L6_9BACT|nr:DUF349 domain-containing protein [Desulfonema ishimotonii]GBC63488.1 hypothetical protein DENIS_4482 [Desulfonema ishimotonii]
MGIRDLLRPKWKHSDPAIRLKAVREMAPEQGERLRQILLEDPDPDVRMAALEKTDDETVLTRLMADRESAALAAAARGKLNAIRRDTVFNTPDARTRIALLEKLSGDEALLTEIACEIDDPAIRLAASEKISDPSLLCRITESHCGLKTGLAVVARLSAPEHLERVVRNATNKKVRNQARQQLDAIGGEASPPSAGDALAVSLGEICAGLEKCDPDRGARTVSDAISAAQAAWAASDPGQTHPLYPRFEKAVSRLETCRRRIEKEAEVRALREALASICDQIARLAEEMPDGAEETFAALGSRWTAADPEKLPDADYKRISRRFQTVCDHFDRSCELRRQQEKILRERSEMLENLCRQAEILSARKDWEEADAAWEPLLTDWKRNVSDDARFHPFRQRFETARTDYLARRQLAQSELRDARKTASERLLALCETVEAAIADKGRKPDISVRAAQQEWRQTGDPVPDLKAELAPRFNDACDRFFAARRERREKLEWEQWANLNRKQELCEAVEQLADREETDGMGKMVREARKAWKEVGPVSREKSDDIWSRFNAACDRICQRCLAEKQNLYDQLCQQIAADADRSAASKEVRAIQARWNAIGPLPLALEKELLDNFRAACDGFFEELRGFYQQRDAERQQNLPLKAALCEKAEALADADAWSETAAQLKALQRQWKKIGPVPRNDEDALWQRFRTACDTFFSRLKAQEPENLSRKEALCAQVEGLVADVSEDTDMERLGWDLMDLQRQWKEIGPVPAEHADALWKRFHTPCDEFFARRKGYMDERDAERAGNQVRKEALIAEAEGLSRSEAWQETGEQLKALQQQWKAVGPADRKAEPELWNRFHSACDIFFIRRKNHFDARDQDRRENMRQKEKLCLSLEALARLVLPEDAFENHPVPSSAAEQLSIALAFKNEVIVPGSQERTWGRVIRKVREIQKAWKEIGPVPAGSDEALWKRYRHGVDLFYSARRAASPNAPADKQPEEETRP